jgi:uncharacterized protein YjlB
MPQVQCGDPGVLKEYVDAADAQDHADAVMLPHAVGLGDKHALVDLAVVTAVPAVQREGIPRRVQEEP